MAAWASEPQDPPALQTPDPSTNEAPSVPPPPEPAPSEAEPSEAEPSEAEPSEAEPSEAEVTARPSPLATQPLLTPVRPQPDQADLFDPWAVPIQSPLRPPITAPLPTVIVAHTELEDVLLDPWSGRNLGLLPRPSIDEPDLRHPFRTDTRTTATLRPARVDLRDPFARAGTSPTSVAMPIPTANETADPNDLRDPFGGHPPVPSLPRCTVQPTQEGSLPATSAATTGSPATCPEPSAPASGPSAAYSPTATA